MRELSKQMWEQRNAFLFDFTLARFAIALLTIIDRQEPYAPFVDAVRNGAPARTIWESLNRTASSPLLDLVRANSAASHGRARPRRPPRRPGCPCMGLPRTHRPDGTDDSCTEPYPLPFRLTKCHSNEPGFGQAPPSSFGNRLLRHLRPGAMNAPSAKNLCAHDANGADTTASRRKGPPRTGSGPAHEPDVLAPEGTEGQSRRRPEAGPQQSVCDSQREVAREELVGERQQEISGGYRLDQADSDRL